MMQDGIPESHKRPKIQQSSPGKQHPTQGAWRCQPHSLPTHCSHDGKTHRGHGLPGNHISGRQFSTYQRGKEHNEGLVRKDSSGAGESHRDTTEGQFPSPLQQGNSWLPAHPLFVCPRGTTRAKALLPFSLQNSACITLQAGKSVGFWTFRPAGYQ